jgi:two-component system chemotaxis response regulator CheY
MNEDCPIMVVDDDVAIREILQAIFEIEGYRVVMASDGAQALQQLRSGVRPCLILLDLRMPGMDGRTFCQLQRAEPQIAGIPVVILSGDRDAPVVAAALGAECIVKPVDLGDLLSLVGRFCPPKTGAAKPTPSARGES